MEKLLLGPILEEHLVATSTYKGYWSFEQCFSSEAGCIFFFRDEIRITNLQGSIARPHREDYDERRLVDSRATEALHALLIQV